ncbi:hypothetical protein EYZ11_008873 [Aspergillus tanneri]|uniref:Uncharacterized protein n=1 Tax=Aspergillus tanneri TaxID=1220188 RepID=A0A4S3J9B5_9EURO|nr:hypothetical protein EYZ11_008873 [Aspergillus tanneri]
MASWNCRFDYEFIIKYCEIITLITPAGDPTKIGILSNTCQMVPPSPFLNLTVLDGD